MIWSAALQGSAVRVYTLNLKYIDNKLIKNLKELIYKYSKQVKDITEHHLTSKAVVVHTQQKLDVL